MRILNNYFPAIFFLYLNLLFAQSQKKDSIKNNLAEVTIIAKNPISEKFSVVKINKLDIYFNPVSNADPLKAITILPASTNVSETANPTLRGGEADRSRVYLNGVPVLNPVRNTQDNGLGNFSIFNTELIEKQYVYASNPPLIYGNSSAGIVEIETNKKLVQENLQFSVAISNVGFLLNKKIGGNNFIQLYANHQFSDLFLKINKKNVNALNVFSTEDCGLNAYFSLSKKFSYNSYNYFINEGYESQMYRLNFSGNSKAKQKRFFSVNSFEYIKGKSKFKLSTLFDFTNQKYNYGVIDSKTEFLCFYSSLSHKYTIRNNISFQYGIDYSKSYNRYNEVRPVYYYALEDGAQSYVNNERNIFKFLESYIYLNYEFSNNFGISASVRKNIPFENQIDFNSYQAASHYELNSKNRFIFSFGNYHSFTTPNYIAHDISLLSSLQAAIDYYYETKKIQFTSAVFFKKDEGSYVYSPYEKSERVKTFGVELSSYINITKFFLFKISNSSLYQRMHVDEIEYNSSLNLKYYIKMHLTYSNIQLFTASLVFSTRPGNFYTKVTTANFNTDANTFQPVFGDFNSVLYSDYSKFDFTINKVFKIKNNGLITYISINNILNTKNQSAVFYNQNYNEASFDLYQQRIIYFGLQYRINKLK